MDTIPERVAKGAALLDEIKPGWDALIDLPFLDLSSPCMCVLGQVFDEAAAAATDGNGAIFLDGFDYVTDDEGLGLLAPSGYGFDCGRIEDAPDVFPLLDAEWRRVITERRTAVAK